MKLDGTCYFCKYYWEDMSTNACDCENDNVTDDILAKYFTECKAGCPCYVEREWED